MNERSAQPISERVLVVDDEVLLTRALCETLQENGFDAIGCSHPQAAIELVRQGGIAVLLSDLAMPGMSGVDLLQAAIEVDPTVVSVVMTGHGSIESAVQAMQSGALDYIQKPFRISAVLAVLARALTVRRLRLENTLLNTRLRERAIELEAANRDLDAFARTVSHDLRGPLSGVIGCAALLENRFAGQVPGDAARLIHNIGAAGQQMNALITDLLRLSRFGAKALDRSTIDIAEMSAEIISELRQRNPERNVELLLGELPVAMADRALIRQVLVNLLANAWRFTRDRLRATIRVFAKSVAKGPRVYCVADNGVGFDMTQASQMFEPFQRLHEGNEGTGVGLSIAKRIIQHHGGRIWAESVPDQGATFSFTLEAPSQPRPEPG
jgi:hypothetical protein